ncbi:hypothetical protein VIN01S_07400 [Vibrio inusitatus NBRC 102082]|uniref:RanBP2-type domain-containing protein n=1 Tax=Vibrio inusitatus NBRC 102082 TaxID=1219070 RepID=A0A4Y3HS86_9VIBR|nr:DUF2007 domain-containing protein [Vibrio inusitatus]GEA49936.1 hypothetical protein VIN01S_07400 [Vibrio inusitatus NBRC 102082]
MKLFVAQNPPQAHILCELLLSHNIQVEVRGEGMFGLQGELPMDDSSLPYLWLIDEHKHKQAKAVITEFEQNVSTSANSEWRCAECDEVNEGQFGLCWQCGHSAS